MWLICYKTLYITQGTMTKWTISSSIQESRSGLTELFCLRVSFDATVNVPAQWAVIPWSNGKEFTTRLTHRAVKKSQFFAIWAFSQACSMTWFPSELINPNEKDWSHILTMNYPGKWHPFAMSTLFTSQQRRWKGLCSDMAICRWQSLASLWEAVYHIKNSHGNWHTS